MKYITISLLLVFSTTLVCGQNLFGLKTAWDDDYKQWVIVADEEELEGEVEMTWRLRNDPREWNIKLDGQRGSIKQKWDNNRNTWVLRYGSELINIATVWSNDFNSYRISDGEVSITIERANYQKDPIEWTIQNEKNGRFLWYNEFDYDNRDWVIIDELEEEISIGIKLAAVLISIINTIYN